ncbi:MAG: DUF192 domain-containing protein [Cyanobacteria bacterium P01_D01_bin.105]
MPILFPRHAATFKSIAFLLAIGVLITSCSTPSGPPPPEESQSTERPTEAINPDITLSGPGQILPVTGTASIKGESFDLEVAVTPQQQQIGLMFRSELPDNRGMLFPFSSPRRASFWMKNVPVPLDIVFLRNETVVMVASQVPPCEATPCPSYGPNNQLVDTVLELRSGRAAELNLQPGDIVTLSDS